MKSKERRVFAACRSWGVRVLKVSVVIIVLLHVVGLVFLAVSEDTHKGKGILERQLLLASIEDQQPLRANKKGADWLIMSNNATPTKSNFPRATQNFNGTYLGDKFLGGSFQDENQDNELDDADQLPPLKSSAIPILLVTYYRGGSTLLGKLFDLHPHPFNPKGFYWFEPLVGVYLRHYKRSGNARSPLYNGYTVEGQSPSADVLSLRQTALDVVTKILTCNVTSLPPEDVLLHPFITGSTMSRRIAMYFRECLVKNQNETVSLRLEICIPVLKRSCVTAHFKAIKTIRLSLRMAAQLLDSIPDLHIIYSYRDPRGILSSRKGLEGSYYMDEAEFSSKSRELCNVMRQDLDEVPVVRKRLQNSPHQFTLLKYEDLALKPVETAGAIYKRLGMELTPGVKNWIIGATTASEKARNPTTVRRNASEVVQKWRHKLTPKMQHINRVICADVLQRLGYDLQ